MTIGTPSEVGRATTSAAVSSLAITLSNPVAAGSLILVVIANRNSAAVVPSGVTDSAGNSYTLISAANSAAVSATIAYAVNAAALKRSPLAVRRSV